MKSDLTRESITAASRVMLPAYPVFLTVVGLNFLLNPHRLQNSPGLRYADSALPLEVWGIGFLVVAVVQVYALVAHSRRTYTTALAIMFVWMLLWTAVIAFAALRGEASFSAWAWPALAARAAWASLVSVKVGEV